MKSSGAKRVMRQNKTSGFGQFFASNELALCYVKIFVQQNVCVQILVTTWTYFVYLEKVTKCKFSQFHKMDISFWAWSLHLYRVIIRVLVEKLFCSFFNPVISLYIYYDQDEKIWRKHQKKNLPRLVSMKMVAILDFRALTKVHITSKPLLQMQWNVAHT